MWTNFSEILIEIHTFLLKKMHLKMLSGKWLPFCICFNVLSEKIALLLSLWWRHNGRDSVSNHQSYHCLLNRLFRRRSKKTSKLRVTGLCAENSPGTGEFSAQMASNAENVSIWWRHHVMILLTGLLDAVENISVKWHSIEIIHIKGPFCLQFRHG